MAAMPCSSSKTRCSPSPLTDLMPEPLRDHLLPPSSRAARGRRIRTPKACPAFRGTELLRTYQHYAGARDGDGGHLVATRLTRGCSTGSSGRILSDHLGTRASRRYILTTALVSPPCAGARLAVPCATPRGSSWNELESIRHGEHVERHALGEGRTHATQRLLCPPLLRMKRDATRRVVAMQRQRRSTRAGSHGVAFPSARPASQRPRICGP